VTGQELQEKIKTALRASRNDILSLIAVTCGPAAVAMYVHGSTGFVIVAALCAVVTCAAVLWLVFRIARTSFGQTPIQDVVTGIAARGLAPYNDGDAFLFWQLGRKTEIRRLIGAIHDTNSPMVLLHGVDGSGKTSALWAGLRPHLEHEGIRCVYCDAAAGDPVLAASKAIQREPDLDVGRNLAEILDDKTRTVLIIDSFEHLDLALPENSPFLLLLQALHNQPPPHRVQVVGAFRDRYLGIWNAIEAQTGLRATRLQLGLLPLDVGSRNLELVLEESDINFDKAIIRDFVRTAAEDQVSPIDIAIGGRVFAEWAAERPGQHLRSIDYASEGGAIGVWRRHIQRYMRSYVPESEHKILITVLANKLTNPDSGTMNVAGISATTLSTATQLEVGACERYLSDMASRSVRILDIVPGHAPQQYRLARESFVIALKQLQQELIAPSDHMHQFLMERLHSWKRSDEDRDLLSGELLKLAITHQKAGSISRELSDYIKKSHRAQRRRRLGTGLSISALVLLFVFGSYFFKGYLQKTALASWLLPGDLYERQGQFKVLAIRGYSITNLDWLKYADFRNLEITEARLSSVTGIKNLRSADNITLDLSHTSIADLKDIASVPGLTALSLSLGHSQVTNLAELRRASKLTTLTLSLGGSSIRSIGDLANCTQLRKLTMGLSGSSVQDISVLSTLNNLKTLTLEVEAPQVAMIADVTRSTSIEELTLMIENPRKLHGPPMTRSIPSLSSMENLKKLAIIFKPGSTLDNSAANIYPPVASLDTLHIPDELRELAIDLGGFPITSLPQTSHLRRLTKLSLHSQGSGLARLPAFSRSAALEDIDLSVDAELASMMRLADFRDLRSLSLAINGPKLRTLPQLKGLVELRELNLDLSQTAITDFRQLSSLRSLRELELHLTGTQSEELPPLTSLQELRSIGLYLSGAARTLPSLALDHDLPSLTLGLQGSSLDRLPNLGQFKNVQTLALFLAGSQVHAIDSLPQAGTVTSVFLDVSDTPNLHAIPLTQFRELTDLTIALRGSAIQSMPDVSSLIKLKSIALDVRNSAFTDFSQLHGFRAVRDLTVDQSCSSLSNVPPDAQRIAFLWTTR
jgi:hypothetical protein